MANKLTLAIAVKLTKEEFERGINRVKSSIRGLQMRTMAMATAFGSGVYSMSSFLSVMRKVAVETNAARTALKNVSNSMYEFGQTEKYLIDLANTYGQSINVLEHNFAQFQAAAKGANLPLSEVKEIFRVVSKANAAYGLSTQQSELVFIGLKQMMSKSKVSAEELRRQIGEQIPIAFSAMAKAAGKTESELDEALKAGTIRSKDVLADFAKELDNMMGEVDVDNLGTSIAKLKNFLIELVRDNNVVEGFKGIVDAIIGLLNFLKNNTLAVIGAILGWIGTNVYNKLSKQIVSRRAMILESAKAYRSAKHEEIAAEKALQTQQEKRLTLEAKLATLRDEQASKPTKRRAKSIASSEKRLQRVDASIIKTQENLAIASKKRIDAQDKLNAARAMTRWQAVGRSIKLMWASVATTMRAVASTLLFTAIFAAIGAIINAVRDYIKALHTAKDIQKELNKEIDQATHSKEIVAIDHTIKQIEEKRKKGEEYKYLLEKGIDLLGEEYDKNSDILAQLREKKRLMELTAKEEVLLNKKADLEIQKRTLEKKDAQKREAFLSGDTSDLDFGERILRSFRGDALYNEQDRNRIASGTPLGGFLSSTESKTLEGVNASLIDINEQLADVGVQIGERKEADTAVEKQLRDARSKKASQIEDLDARKKTGVIGDSEYNDEKKKIQRLYDETVYQLDGQKDKHGNIYRTREDKEFSGYNVTGKDKTHVGRGSTRKTESGEQRARREYLEEITKLTNQLSVEGKTEEEIISLKEDMQRARKRYVEFMEGQYGVNANADSLYNAVRTDYKREADDIKDRRAAEERRKSEQEWANGIEKQRRNIELQWENGKLSNKQYQDAMLDLVDAIIEHKEALENLTEEDTRAISELYKMRDDMAKQILPKRNERTEQDKLFDYKRTAKEIKAAEYENLSDYIKALEQEGKVAEEALREARSEATKLQQAITIETIQEDIKSLKKELNSGYLDGVKSIAGTMRHSVDAIKSLKETMNDVDSSPIEKLLNVFNSMMQLIDGLMSFVDTMKKIRETTEALSGATAALQAAQTAGSIKQIAMNTTEAASAEVLANAYFKTAAAKMIAKYAAIPGGVALASGEIAAAGATVKGAAAIVGMKNGGRVEFGELTGDKSLIRVNRGERVLTVEQQQYIDNLAKNMTRDGGSDKPIRVVGRLVARGKDLEAVFDNYKRYSKR